MILDATPDDVREGALSCLALGTRAAALGHVLEAAVAGRWESPAGSAFGDRVAEHLPFVRGAADRLVATGRILLRFADALGESQDRYLVAQLECAAATDGLTVAHDLLLHGGPTQEQAVALRLGLQDYEGRRLLADARLARVVREWEDTEARYAAELDAVAHDGIRDDDTYRRLHTAQRVADHGAMLGVVPGPQQVLTAPLSAWAATTSTGLSVGFRLGYGEGEWSEIGAAVALERLRTAGKVLKLGAKALPPHGLAPERVLSATERIRAGARQSAHDTYWRGPVAGADDLAAAAGPVVAGSLARRLVSHARSRAGAELDKRYRNDFRIATTGGSTAKRMLVTAWAFEGSATVVGGVGPVRSAQDRLRAARRDRDEERRVD